jgi:GNAT superfamily N-acetyltransferase
VSNDEQNRIESQQPLIEPLTKEHNLEGFDCGRVSLNDWLKRFALINQQNDSVRTYVLTFENKVIGYYSLTTGACLREEAPARAAKGLAAHPIGVILLARLAVDLRRHGEGWGAGLLHDALRRASRAADLVGARAVMVQAIDENAAAFYRRFGFEPSPTSPKQLMLLLKDLRAGLEKAPQ